MTDTTLSRPPISGGGRQNELTKWLGFSGQAVGVPRRQGNRFETSGVSLRVARQRPEQTRERGAGGEQGACCRGGCARYTANGGEEGSLCFGGVSFTR